MPIETLRENDDRKLLDREYIQAVENQLKKSNKLLEEVIDILIKSNKLLLVIQLDLRKNKP